MDHDHAVLRAPLTDLVNRYAALADQRRTAELAGLFSADGLLVLPDPPQRLDAHIEHTGREAIAAHLQVLHDVPVTVHELTGSVFEWAGDRHATGRTTCAAHHVYAERDIVWHLHYDDAFVLADAGWRIHRRALHIDFITTARVSTHR